MALANTSPFGPPLRAAMGPPSSSSGSNGDSNAQAWSDVGERKAFLACYEQHHAQVFCQCLRFAGGRRAFAEDLTQDVFIKLMSQWRRLQDRRDLGGWLYRVAANMAVSKLRRERTWRERVRDLLVIEPAPPPGPDSLLATREAAAAVADVLRALPPKQRVVLVMRVLDGASQRDIAATLDLSEGYVSKLLSRAQATVRKAGWELSNE